MVHNLAKKESDAARGQKDNLGAAEKGQTGHKNEKGCFCGHFGK